MHTGTTPEKQQPVNQLGASTRSAPPLHAPDHSVLKPPDSGVTSVVGAIWAGEGPTHSV